MNAQVSWVAAVVANRAFKRFWVAEEKGWETLG